MSVTLNSDEERELYEKFKKIMERERKPVSTGLKELMAEYIKQHGAGNDSYKLTEFDKGLIGAYPTIWKPWEKSDLDNYSEIDLKEMSRLVNFNLIILKKKMGSFQKDPVWTERRRRADEMMSRIPGGLNQ